MTHLIARISNRALLGLSLCRNEQFLHAVMRFAETLCVIAPFLQPSVSTSVSIYLCIYCFFDADFEVSLHMSLGLYTSYFRTFEYTWRQKSCSDTHNPLSRSIHDRSPKLEREACKYSLLTWLSTLMILDIV
jgi:hypothetical protein